VALDRERTVTTDGPPLFVELSVNFFNEGVTAWSAQRISHCRNLDFLDREWLCTGLKYELKKWNKKCNMSRFCAESVCPRDWGESGDPTEVPVPHDSAAYSGPLPY
jgi:hypothetical protein